MLSKKNKSVLTSQIFRELARKNVRKSAKDYFIYFFTLMLSVCLFYSFNSVSTQFASLGIEDRLNYLAFSSGMLNAFSVIVCFIMGSLVVYANRFMLRRRKKEMGIYATLGMERRELNRLLMKETLRIGVFSLIAGIILGIFAAQILSLLTAKLAGISLASYHFMISIKAILLSILFFGILFFFVHCFNIKEIKKMTLLDMLYSDRKNEVVSEEKKGPGWLMAFFSVILMVGGYALLILLMDNSVFKALGTGGIMLIAGTVFFFMAMLRITAGFMKKNRCIYYRKLNIFTTSQFSSRQKSEGVTMGVTSVLLFLSLALVMLGPGFGKYVINGIENAAPYGGTIYYALFGQQEKNENPMEVLKNAGFDIGEFSESYETFWIYNEPTVTSDLFTGEVPMEEDKMPLTVIGVEDYNRLMALQNKEQIQLSDDEYAVTYAFPAMEKKLENFRENPKKITIGDTALSMAQNGIFQNSWQNRNALVEEGTIVVPQYLTDTMKKSVWYLDFNFKENTEEMHTALYDSWYASHTDGFQMWVGQEALISVTADNLLMTYLGLYLGITFLITSGAVLAIQQMAHSTDNVKRYQLLKNLGASQREMRHSLMKQLRVCFGMPMLVAVLHTAVVISVVFRKFEGLEAGTLLTIAGVGVLMVFIVYAVYFISTYLGSKRVLQLK